MHMHKWVNANIGDNFILVVPHFLNTRLHSLSEALQCQFEIGYGFKTIVWNSEHCGK